MRRSPQQVNTALEKGVEAMVFVSEPNSQLQKMATVSLAVGDVKALLAKVAECSFN